MEAWASTQIICIDRWRREDTPYTCSRPLSGPYERSTWKSVRSVGLLKLFACILIHDVLLLIALKPLVYSSTLHAR